MALKLTVRKIYPNLLVHWLNQKEVWASRNYTFYISKDQGVTFNKAVELQSSALTNLLGGSRLLTRAFRLGIRDSRELRSGTILAIADKKIFRLHDREFEAVHLFQQGRGPLREGWCEDHKGNCYLGEYVLNNQRDKSINLLKSSDDGHTWKTIRSFRNIRHIHCVQFDPFSQAVWMGTGDKDHESSIAFSENDGNTWNTIGSGNQKFRTVSLVFTEDFVYWVLCGVLYHHNRGDDPPQENPWSYLLL